MWTLRAILIVIGLLFIVGLYLYTRRHPPRRKRQTERESLPHVEPDWASWPDTAVDSVAASETIDAPSSPANAGVEKAEPKPETTHRESEIFTLAVRLPDEGVAVGEVARLLTHLGCEPGADGIYHYPGDGERSLYSVANLFEPGVLHPLPPESRLHGFAFFFASQPGEDAAASFDRMLGAARESAQNLGGRMQDAGHRPLTAARELELKTAAASHD